MKMRTFFSLGISVLFLAVTALGAAPNISVTVDGQVYQCGINGGGNHPDPECPDKVTNFCNSKGGNIWDCMNYGTSICQNSTAGTGDCVVGIASFCTNKGGNLWDCMNNSKSACAGAPKGTGDCVLRLATTCTNAGGNLWDCLGRATAACKS